MIQKHLIRKCETCGRESIEGGSIIVNSLPEGASYDELNSFYLYDAEYEDICYICAEREITRD